MLNSIEHLDHSLLRLVKWLEDHGNRAYEPFDALTSPLAHRGPPSKIYRQSLIQLVKRIPINLRPVLGIAPVRNTKGLAFIAKGYIWLHAATGDGQHRKKACDILEQVAGLANRKYSGIGWGNHFDYQSRGYFLRAFEPTLVWTSLIGQIYVQAYEQFHVDSFLDIARQACQFIVKDLPHVCGDKKTCISYICQEEVLVHNANLLGASLLSRVYKHTLNEEYKRIAGETVSYSCHHQLPDGGWYYGEEKKFHWIDNFHTGYNLESIKTYIDSTGDERYAEYLARGYKYYVEHFILDDGTAKYFHDRMYPIDIQSIAQSIETLISFGDIKRAYNVAEWALDNMQDPSGYFYYQKGRYYTNKIPMLHWGQGTMLSALARLSCVINRPSDNQRI